jgi:hypothetical protein
MEAWYVACGVTDDQLATAIMDERLTWAYAERLEDILLGKRDDLLCPRLESWIHARAFGPRMELSWWRLPKGIQIRCIVLDGKPPASISWIHEQIEWQPVAGLLDRILLVGEHDPRVESDRPLWSTMRIPRYLAYPLESNSPRVALVQQVYSHNGYTGAIRLVALEEAGNG